jgi:hypothetical protein
MGSITLALEPLSPAVVDAQRLRAAHKKVWARITKRLLGELRLEDRFSLSIVTLRSDPAGLTFAWTAAAAPRIDHFIELAAAMESASLDGALAPLGLRWRPARSLYEALASPGPTGGPCPCGMCLALRADPVRWGALSPDALASLTAWRAAWAAASAGAARVAVALDGLASPFAHTRRAASAALPRTAARTSPAQVLGTLGALLRGADVDAAETAAGHVEDLLRGAPTREKPAFAALALEVLRHPALRVARAGAGCARALEALATPAHLDAWAQLCERLLDDRDAHGALAEPFACVVRWPAAAAADDALAARLEGLAVTLGALSAVAWLLKQGRLRAAIWPALAAPLVRSWEPLGTSEERVAFVRDAVAKGHAEALATAFRELARAPTPDRVGHVGRVGLGLSWAMQRAGAWAEGGVVAEAAARVAPAHARPNLLYNQACGFAMCGDAVGAARVLREAIALDPKQADDARHDADFAPVRAHEALVALLGAATATSPAR